VKYEYDDDDKLAGLYSRNTNCRRHFEAGAFRRLIIDLYIVFIVGLLIRLRQLLAALLTSQHHINHIGKRAGSALLINGARHLGMTSIMPPRSG